MIKSSLCFRYQNMFFSYNLFVTSSSLSSSGRQSIIGFQRTTSFLMSSFWVFLNNFWYKNTMIRNQLTFAVFSFLWFIIKINQNWTEINNVNSLTMLTMTLLIFILTIHRQAINQHKSCQFLYRMHEYWMIIFFGRGF